MTQLSLCLLGKLQISEVVNSMKDLMDCSQETGKGPMEEQWFGRG
ncbi:hypothetical protein Patl1_27916 [Pistacia atlantica]|uniref:Uncharacterized protein n=1 Tax=Pistacia atlantica TaxID=434234 RepID=A0ACC1BCH8_9ROSI|nr:hypothetical protein Patl1_27916 [Pistacia atlantica]